MAYFRYVASIRSATSTVIISVCTLALACGAPRLSAQSTGKQQDYAGFVERMNATHRSPYVPYTGWSLLSAEKETLLLQQWQSRRLHKLEEELCPRLSCLNDRVNQDLNPYPKSVGGLAVDVTDPLNVVAATYDNRLGPTYVTDFVHVSTSAGLLWSDYAEQFAGDSVQQIPRGVTIDRAGHTYVAIDSHDDFMTNTDTSVAVQLDPQIAVPNAVIDSRRCLGDSGDDCNEVLQTQGVRTDLSNGANDGTTYVFYDVFCTASGFPCEGGALPEGGSVIKVASSPQFNQPFGIPAVWSGPGQLSTGMASMVIDSTGKAHLFYLDYTHAPQISLWESTNGVPNTSAILTFADAGLNNPNWSFGEDKLLDCAGRGTMAFCAFPATQVGNKRAETTPDIYLVAINLVNDKTALSRVNDDPPGKGKDHFDPSIAVTADGEIFVSWFDDRRDPNDLRLDYFLGKSTDGGRAFSRQTKVNQDSFDPTIGVVGPSGAIAPQGSSHVKAIWTDTSNGESQEIRSATVEGW